MMFKTFSTLAVATAAVVSCFSYEAAAGSISDLMASEPEFSEVYSFAKSSGFFDSFDTSDYGGSLTLVLPSNEAFRSYLNEHPVQSEHLANDAEDFETLALFAATDYDIQPAFIREGDFEEVPLISLLSEESTITRDGKLCIQNIYGTRNCNEEPCCANILNVDTGFEADDGHIYLIDQVLLPQELINKFASMNRL